MPCAPQAPPNRRRTELDPPTGACKQSWAVAPLIDLFALYGLLFSNPVPVLAFWLGFNALQVLLATFAFRMDKESLRSLWALPRQQFVYRQLMYVVIIESTISALAGARAHWRHLRRTGDVEVKTA